MSAAERLTPEQRGEVCRGARPLVLPRAPAPASRIDWNAINDDDLVEAVRQIGIDRALAAAVEAERGA